MAWNLADYASMLLDRGASGDPAKAVKLQDEALNTARDLGMKPLVERILRRPQILKA